MQQSLFKMIISIPSFHQISFSYHTMYCEFKLGYFSVLLEMHVSKYFHMDFPTLMEPDVFSFYLHKIYRLVTFVNIIAVHF